jgi:hypothetical protein
VRVRAKASDLLRSRDIDATTTGPVEGWRGHVRACRRRRSTACALATGQSRRLHRFSQARWAISRGRRADTLVWPHLPTDAEQVVAQLERWAAIEEMADCR